MLFFFLPQRPNSWPDRKDWVNICGRNELISHPEYPPDWQERVNFLPSLSPSQSDRNDSAVSPTGASQFSLPQYPPIKPTGTMHQTVWQERSTSQSDRNELFLTLNIHQSVWQERINFLYISSPPLTAMSRLVMFQSSHLIWPERVNLSPSRSS